MSAAGSGNPYRSPGSRDDESADEASDSGDAETRDGNCPACRGDLEERELDGVVVTACKLCAGHFVMHDAMLALAEKHAAKRSGSHSPYAPRERTPERTLRCPTCDRAMTRSFFAHGCPVLVDVCVEHGTWFDARELEMCLSAVGAGARWTRPASTPLQEPMTAEGPQRRALIAIARVAEALARAARSGDVREIQARFEQLRRLFNAPDERGR
jgi:Zn-finger nucleic acid-binding protein